MKTKHTMNGGLAKKAFRLMIPAVVLSALSVSAQITETMGTVGSTTTIATHETNNNFDNDGLTYSGTGDVRNTTPSTAYTGASGGANIFLNTGKNFVISNLGTNSCSGAPVTLSFGILKSTNAENGSNLAVEYSTDGGSNWNSLSFAALPTGSGTAHWYLRTISGLPSTCNLKVRFSNLASSGPQFRIDDVVTSCGRVVESNCTATITANDTNVFCSGDSVVLTASAGDSYLWSNGATTQSVTIFNSGTYSVSIESNCCFATSTGFYVLVHNDGNLNPVVGVSVDNDTVCAGDSVTLTARTFARDLFFSQYMEGTGLNKIVEIYNGTGAAVNLSGYEIRTFHNGACDNVAPTFTIALSNVILNDGDVYIVANPSHATTVTPDQTSSNLQFNGDDAVTLFNIAADQYSDIIGSICNDPGSAWTGTGIYRTEDRTLTRKPCVYEGIIVNPNLAGVNGFPTLVPEWIVDTTNIVTGFGSHTMGANAYNWTPQPTVPATGSIVKAAVGASTTFVVNGEYCDGCPYAASVAVTVDCEGGGERVAAPASNNQIAVNANVYPNPFNGNVTINVTTLSEGPVTIEIVNMLGEKVAVISNTTLAAGNYTFTWNGAASNGTVLADGVYSCNVITAAGVQNVMLVKSAK
jgi:hypothetical protein